MNPADTTQARRFHRALATTRPEDGSIADDAMAALQLFEEMSLESARLEKEATAARRTDSAAFYGQQSSMWRHASVLLSERLGLSCPIYAKPLSATSTVRTCTEPQNN